MTEQSGGGGAAGTGVCETQSHASNLFGPNAPCAWDRVSQTPVLAAETKGLTLSDMNLHHSPWNLDAKEHRIQPNPKPCCSEQPFEQISPQAFINNLTSPLTWHLVQ